MLSQMAARSGVSQGSDTALRPPRTQAPAVRGRRADMNAATGLDFASILGSHPVRGAARHPAQHQGRRIFLDFGPLARLDAEGRAAFARHHEPLSLPADVRTRSTACRCLIVMATTNRGYILDLVPGSELHRVPAQARLRRLHARLERAAAGGEEPAHGGLRPRLHPGLRPPRAGRFRRAGRLRDRLLLRRRAVAALRLDPQGRADEESDLLHHADRLPRDEAVLQFLRPALFRRRPPRRQRRQRAAGDDPVLVRDAAPGLAHGEPDPALGETSGTTSS